MDVGLLESPRMGKQSFPQGQNKKLRNYLASCLISRRQVDLNGKLLFLSCFASVIHAAKCGA
jgi:hypothetical protein